MSADLAYEFDDKTAHDLQWAELLESVMHHARSEAAQVRLAGLRPYADRALAQAAQQLAAEAVHLVERDAALPVGDCPDIGDLCSALERQTDGSAEQFRDAGRCVTLALRLRDHCSHHETRCPDLKRLLWCAPELTGLLQRIVRCIDDQGQVLDSASEGLANARRALSRARTQLRDSGNQLLARYKDALAGQYLAERNGRFVLPVRADSPERVAGMILGASGSGSTLYIEPRELTECNNRVYVAEAEALREEAKVLAELSQSAFSLSPALRRAAENCVQADVLAAIGTWAHTCGALPVTFAEQPVLHLLRMRHPLLAARGPTTKVVANDLHLEAGQCLVISGPNAGGKTVALKCLGLAVWLAQAGLPVPCDAGSELGWFEHVYTDIGDEQSISQSLSTFSAHIQRLSQFLQHAGRGTLILLDEVAGGTDPDEGAALATAILEQLVKNEASVATTTHYERLKRLGAAEGQAFINASVGFDWQSMLPTFVLSLGIPGQSSALAVAERYGIKPALVERAWALLPQEQLHQRALLEQLEDERGRLSTAREQTEAQLIQIQEQAQQQHAALLLEQEQERKQLNQQARELMQEVMEARTLVQRAKAELKLRADIAGVRQAEQWLSTAAQTVSVQGKVTQALRQPPSGAQLQQAQLSPGTRVHIPHLDTTGEVVSEVSKGTVRVSVGGLKLTVPVDKLRAVPTHAAPKTTPAAKAGNAGLRNQRRKAAAAVPAEASGYVPARTSSNTCDLRGLRVEAGLEAASVFIDRMLQLNEPAVYFLHGHGTGAMKDAVRQYLNQSQHVTRWEPATPEDGGDALTLGWL